MILKVIKIFSVLLILCLVVSTSNANIYVPSDSRLSNVDCEFNDGVDKIKELKTYNYTYKADKKKIPHVGVIAQDLQKVFPNAVSKRSDGYLMIRLEDMFYAMLNSIKQLDKIVEGITKDVKLLFARLQKIDDKIISLIKTDNANIQRINELDLESQKLDSEAETLEARLAKLEKSN